MSWAELAEPLGAVLAALATGLPVLVYAARTAGRSVARLADAADRSAASLETTGHTLGRIEGRLQRIEAHLWRAIETGAHHTQAPPLGRAASRDEPTEDDAPVVAPRLRVDVARRARP